MPLVANGERPTTSVRLHAEDGRCEPFTVSTVTFFRSNDGTPHEQVVEKICSHLRARLRLVLLKNPWLAGRLTKTNVLTFPQHFYHLDKTREAELDEAALEAALDKILDIHEVDRLPICMPEEALGSGSGSCGKDSEAGDLGEEGNTYAKLVEACNARCFCDNRCGVLKVTVCRTEDSDIVAVMVALAHAVGDGNTYYRILNMLSGEGSSSQASPEADTKDATEALVAERPSPVRTVDHGLDRIMGREQRRYRRSLTMIKHGVWGNLRLPGCCGERRNESMNAFRISPAEILRIKQQSLRQQSTKFLGSNDIIVSQFAKVTDPRLLLMVIDARKYLARDPSVPIPDGRASDLAGNYVTHWMYGPGNYGTPEAVRNVKTAFGEALLKNDALLAAPRHKRLTRALWRASTRLSRAFTSSKVKDDEKKKNEGEASDGQPKKSLDVDIGYEFVAPRLGETVRFALISSWIFDFSFEIPGMEHVLHLPTFPNPASLVSWEFAIVFRATPRGDLGMVVSSSRVPASHYQETMSVLDGPFWR